MRKIWKDRRAEEQVEEQVEEQTEEPEQSAEVAQSIEQIEQKLAQQDQAIAAVDIQRQQLSNTREDTRALLNLAKGDMTKRLQRVSNLALDLRWERDCLAKDVKDIIRLAKSDFDVALGVGTLLRNLPGITDLAKSCPEKEAADLADILLQEGTEQCQKLT